MLYNQPKISLKIVRPVGAGHAGPAAYRNISFTVQFVGEGFIPPGHPPTAANGHGGQRAGRPTTPLKNPCVGRGALTPPPLFPSRTPAVFAYSLQTLPFPHKTGDIFAKALPRLYHTMVDTRKKRRYNRVVPMRTHPKHYTKNNIGEKGEYFT